MATPTLSSLLGLAPAPPVIAPSAVEKRLSKLELRVATAAFHRARGYGDRIDFPRLRDTVLQEGFTTMPLYVMQRVFIVWNFLEGSTAGALTSKEFLVGVTITWKGTREEHLRFAFQLMDRHGEQELSKRDAMSFVPSVARKDGIVAVEQTSGKRYDVDQFLSFLFPSDKTMLTSSKFVKLVMSKQFTWLAIVDWIPKLARQFNHEKEKEKLTMAILAPQDKIQSPLGDRGEVPESTAMASILVKIRRLGSADSTDSPRRSPALHGAPSPAGCSTIIQIEVMDANQFQALKSAIHKLVEWVLSTKESVNDEDFREQLSECLPSTVIEATIQTAQACAGDFVLSALAMDHEQATTTTADAARSRAKIRLFWWLACICCSLARSSTEVLRYLFVLLDTSSLGYWTMDQLTTFIQCVDFRNEDQSSKDEAAFLAQTTFDEVAMRRQRAVCLDSSSTQKDKHPMEMMTEDDAALIFQFRDFGKYLVQHPVMGCSLVETEIMFTIFHLELARQRGVYLSHRYFLEALSGYCDQLKASAVTTQYGYSLLSRATWERIVDWLCDYDSELPLGEVLKTQMCTYVTPPTAPCGPSSSNSGENGLVQPQGTESLVTVPISLWLVLASRLHDNHTRSAITISNWTEAASRLVFPSSAGSIPPDRSSSPNGSWPFCAFVTSVEMTIAARDGSECRICIPQCVVDQEMSLQTLVEAVLTIHGRDRGTHRKGTATDSTFYCEGDVVFSNGDDETTNHRVHVSQGALLIALHTLDERGDSQRIRITLNVVLTDERSNSYISQWTSPALASPSSSISSPASSKTPRQVKRNGVAGWTKVHGLANLGNTCFMNSALQCLAATPLFRDYFLKEEHLFDLASHTVAVPSTGSPFRPGRKVTKPIEQCLPKSSLLPVAFGQLLSEMNSFSSSGSVSGMADVVSPKHMKGAIATLFPHLSDGTQQDAQEFISSLLSSLSDELKRLPLAPSVPETSFSLAVSPSLLSRFSPLSRTKSSNSTSLPTSISTDQDARQLMLSKLQFQVNDSDGRADAQIAKEWWVSHLLAEPSIVTALFCGQFKSTLRCGECGYSSSRFEPFSSLQLPLLDETAMLSPRQKPAHQQVVVVLHFLDSPCKRPSLRLVIQAGHDWTIEQLLIKLQQDHATYSTTGMRQDYIAATLKGFTVDDYLDTDAPLSSLAKPINIFEIEFGDQALAFNSAPSPRSRSSAEPFEEGADVLTRSSHGRWVHARIERQGLLHVYHICNLEVDNGTRTTVDRSDIRPFTTKRLVLLRFVHRRQGLVPFYSTSPYRQVLCGFPFVCRLPTSGISGRTLYHMIHRKFCAVEVPSQTPPNDFSRQKRRFVLKRVRSDGKSCGSCHWSDQCDGCQIDRLDEELLDLQMDETIAIDWILDAHELVDGWLASGYCIEDHTSYVAYKLDNTHSLDKSLEILCSEEQMEARCSHCTSSCSTSSETQGDTEEHVKPTQTAFVPHTKKLSLWSLPPILVIQLKRFELVADRGYTWQRLNHNVDFPIDDFDIRRFLGESEPAKHNSKQQQTDPDEVVRAESFLTEELHFPIDTASRTVASYRLYGIVNHMGDLGGGHYTAHIRHPDNADWWLVDDASAAPANPQTLAPSSTAYLLFYVREDLDPTLEEDDQDGIEQQSSSRAQTLPDFYPRHPHATRVAESAVRSLFKQQDFWQRTVSRVADINMAPSASKRDDGNCAMM